MVSLTALINEYGDGNFFPRKRQKIESEDLDCNTCLGIYASHTQLCGECCSFDGCTEEISSTSPMNMSCQSSGHSDNVPQSGNSAGTSFDNKAYHVYAPTPGYATGWTYVNENGQMCGPYIQQQLYEGLSSGYLPDELHVYPVVNGNLINPVPLKYFKMFPDHVATGFAYISPNVVSGTNMPLYSSISCSTAEGLPSTSSTSAYSYPQAVSNTGAHNCNPSIPQMSGENSCWLFEGSKGMKQGPHSLLELCSWHRYGYLQDSTMIYHVENKYRPLPLLSILNTLTSSTPESAAAFKASSDETGSLESFISQTAEVFSSQLHSGILKAARRVLLDEIISGVVSEFVADKKAQRRRELESVREAEKASLINDKMSLMAGKRKLHDTSESEKAAFRGVSDRMCNSKQLLQSSAGRKSVGSVENTYEVVCKMLFDYCRQDMWNAVFYDTVADYLSAWRKKRLWFGHPRFTISSVNCKDYGEKTMNIPDGPLLEGQESSTCDTDCPPGFEPLRIEAGNCAQLCLLDASSALLVVDMPSEQNGLPCSGLTNNDMNCIVETVQNELFSSIDACFSEYVQGLVDQEVGSLDDISKEGISNKVALDAIIERPQTNENGSLEMHNKTQIDFSNLSAELILLDNCQNDLEGIKPLHKSVCVNHKLKFLEYAFTKSCSHVDDVVDELETDESLPPGIEDNINIQSSSLSCKFRPSRSDECASKMGVYLAMAMCRQKLLDDVMGDWKSVFADGTLSQFLNTWCTSKKQKRPHSKKRKQKRSHVNGEEKSGASKECRGDACTLLENSREASRKPDGSGSSEASLVIGKYTYVCKACKKISLSSQLVDLADSVPQKQANDKQKKADVSQAAREKTEVEPASVTSKKGKESNKRHARPSGEDKTLKSFLKSKQNDRSAPKSASGKKAAKANEVTTENAIKLQRERVPSINVDCKNAERAVQTAEEQGSASGKKVAKANGMVQKVMTENAVKLRRERVPSINEDCKNAERAVGTAEEQDRHSSRKLLNCKGSKVSKLKRKSSMDSVTTPQPTKVLKIANGSPKQAPSRRSTLSKKKGSKSKASNLCPSSKGCARTSINGWEWRKWSTNASPSERTRFRGSECGRAENLDSEVTTSQRSTAKCLSARTNRVKMRNLLAAIEGADLLKATQLKARKKRLRFQRSEIHDWGLVALESIEAEDFVIEYVGELIRSRISDIREQYYEKMGIGSSYLFRLDDGYVVDATKRGGIARFINHSCEPNCYTKVISLDGEKKIFIYAKRHIAAGEEISYNYKFPLEEKKIPCNCGSKKFEKSGTQCASLMFSPEFANISSSTWLKLSFLQMSGIVKLGCDFEFPSRLFSRFHTTCIHVIVSSNDFTITKMTLESLKDFGECS